MNYGELQLFIEEIPHSMLVKFYLFERRPPGDYINYSHYPDESYITGRKYSSEDLHATDEMKPLFSMPWDMAQKFIKLIATHAQDRGIETKNQSEIKGKLESMERHLNTMELITFKLLAVELPIIIDKDKLKDEED